MEQVLVMDIPFTSISHEFNPVKAHGSDAAYDLYAASEPVIRKTKSGLNFYLEYNTGIKLELPTGMHALILPRSSIRNMDLMMCNPPGLVDSGYRGDLIVCFRLLAPYDLAAYYKKGERIAQLMPIREDATILKEYVSISSETDRGANGFGSSGV
jgi:dUTP pyrophosphatase